MPRFFSLSLSAVGSLCCSLATQAFMIGWVACLVAILLHRRWRRRKRRSPAFSRQSVNLGVGLDMANSSTASTRPSSSSASNSASPASFVELATQRLLAGDAASRGQMPSGAVPPRRDQRRAQFAALPETDSEATSHLVDESDDDEDETTAHDSEAVKPEVPPFTVDL